MVIIIIGFFIAKMNSPEENVTSMELKTFGVLQRDGWLNSTVALQVLLRYI